MSGNGSHNESSKKTSFLASALIASSVLFAIIFLFYGLLDGASFVALMGLILFSFLIYILMPHITELTIAGYSIKLERQINKADELVKRLEILSDEQQRLSDKLLRNEKDLECSVRDFNELQDLTIKKLLIGFADTDVTSKGFYSNYVDYVQLCNSLASGNAILKFADEFLNSASVLQLSCFGFIWTTQNDRIDKDELSVVNDKYELLNELSRDHELHHIEEISLCFCKIYLHLEQIKLLIGNEKYMHTLPIILTPMPTLAAWSHLR